TRRAGSTVPRQSPEILSTDGRQGSACCSPTAIEEAGLIGAGDGLKTAHPDSPRARSLKRLSTVPPLLVLQVLEDMPKAEGVLSEECGVPEIAGGRRATL